LSKVLRVFGGPLIITGSGSGEHLLYPGNITIAVAWEGDRPVLTISKNGVGVTRLAFIPPSAVDALRPVDQEVLLLGDPNPEVRKRSHDYLCGVVMYDPSVVSAIMAAHKNYERVPDIRLQLDDVLTYAGGVPAVLPSDVSRPLGQRILDSTTLPTSKTSHR
jgi:hypothetical protein